MYYNDVLKPCKLKYYFVEQLNHSYVHQFHNIMIDWEVNHHLLQIFITTISKYSLHDLSNLNLYGKLSNCDSFCVHHSFAYQNFMKRLLGHQELSRLYKFSLFCNWSFINIVCTFFLTIGHFVATPLWGKCEDETCTPKSGKLGSSEIPATSELNCRGQNTLP
jgi:hypothetical protein